MADHSGMELFPWLLGEEVYPLLNQPITFWAAKLEIPHPPTTHLNRDLRFSMISLQGARETSVCIENGEMINAHEPVIVLG